MRLPIVLVFAVCVLACRQTQAQIENPVYVDDSPQAWEMFRQARDQTQNNTSEAVRLYQELLDEFGMRLIPLNDAGGEQYRSVRQRVNAELKRDQTLLERYRLIQKQTAEELLAAAELEKLALTRSLTTAGLEAMMRLAQQYLEAGNFHSAQTWLAEVAEHPDLNARPAAHAAYMHGVAALFLGDRPSAENAAARLSQMGAEAQPLQKSLLQLIADSSGVRASALSTLDQGNAQPDDLRDLVAQSIWSFPLEDSLLRRRLAVAQEEPLASQPQAQFMGAMNVEARVRESDFITVVPTVAGDAIYVNEGHTIRKLNRLTGRQLWEYSNLNRISATERDVQGSMDLNVVAVGNGAVVAVTGHALPTGRSENGRVICLDAESGSFRWTAALSNLPGLPEAPSNEQLFPHGAPIIADQMAFVAARRVTTQAITSAYVIALDLASGQPRWVRYITSSGGLRPLRPFDSLAYKDGALYAATAIGAAARIEPTTGEIRWLARFNAPFNAGLAEQGRRPWEMTTPLITDRGVLLIEPDLRRVTLLDKETGSQLESHPATGASEWSSPRYLLADETRVYAIGADIRAFELENLQQAVWKIPDAARQQSDLRGGDAAAASPAPVPSRQVIDLRARVHVASGALIAPTGQGLLIIDSEQGEIMNHLPVQHVGNPLAIDSQLLMATGDRLDSYMSFARAEQMLRERLAQSPRDPEPALSMLRLAIRVQNLALALESADLATTAINFAANAQSAASRNELLSLLLELASMNIDKSAAEGESLYAALNTAAVESEQRVEYLLAYAAWLARHDLNRAVETYQTILSDQNLAAAWRVQDGAMRPSAAWARQRIAELIAQHGPDVYASQADFAAMRLRQLIGGERTSQPAALAALADEFPFAEAAIDAATQAAALHMAKGEHRSAAAILLQASRVGALTAPQQARLLGAFASICTKAGWNDQLEALLRHAAIEHPGMELVTDAGSIRPLDWLATNTSTTTRRLPNIGSLASNQSQSISGSIVVPSRNGFAFTSSTAAVMGALLQPSPANRTLVRAGNTMRLFGNNVSEALWTTAVDEISAGASTLLFDDNRILLWSAADQSEPRAVLMNAADGSRLWGANIREFLGEPQPREQFRGRRDQLPDGEPFDPNHIIPIADQQTLFCIQRNGTVAAIDLNDGRTVRWARRANNNAIGLDQVHAVMRHDSTLFIAGVVREPGTSSELAPKIVALDARTGENVLANSATLSQFGRAGVVWMRLSPIGTMIFGTATGIHAIDVFSGKRLWSNSSYNAMESQRAWCMSQRSMIVEDQRGRLRHVALATGEVSESFEPPSRGEWDPQELRALHVIGDRAITLYAQRTVIYNPISGSIVGADVISDDRDYRWLLPAQDVVTGESRLIVVNGRSTQAVIDGVNTGSRRTQWSYRVYILSENGRVIGDPLELQPLADRVHNATVMDGWLLLSSHLETVALPLNGK